MDLKANSNNKDSKSVRYFSKQDTNIKEKSLDVLNRQEWIFSDFKIINFIMIIRLCAVFTTSISDCDETFNYWEPTHFLLFGKGHQTWEYDPKFALRSYFYLILHGLPGYILNLVPNINRIFIFYFIKSMLAVLCTLSEVYFYKGVSKISGVNVGQIALIFSVLSTGMYISSTAFLPSSTSMLLLMVSHGAWYRGSYKTAIFSTAASTFLSWPFAALLGLPIAIDIVFRKRNVSMGKIQFLCLNEMH